MKKILIMLFILIFDFSYSALDTEAENIVIKKEFQEKLLRQSNSFSKCFKTGLADFEEMNNLMEKFLKMSEEILDTSKYFSLERLKNEKESVNDGKIMPLRRCKSATPSCHCDGVKVPLKNPKVIKNFGIYTILFFS